MQMRNAAVFKLSRRNTILGSLALLCGLSKASPAGTITDAGKVSVSVTAPKRIVTIGSAITEIVFALGEKNNVVAIDLTSIGVAGAEGHDQCGLHAGPFNRRRAFKALSASASPVTGPPEVLDAFGPRAFPLRISLPMCQRLRASRTRSGLLGELLDKAAEAEKLNGKIEGALPSLRKE